MIWSSAALLLLASLLYVMVKKPLPPVAATIV